MRLNELEREGAPKLNLNARESKLLVSKTGHFLKGKAMDIRAILVKNSQRETEIRVFEHQTES